MDCRFRWLAVLTFVSLSVLPGLANSAPKDTAANKLADDAINNDYLATNFAEAEKKLQRAIKTCGTNGCSAHTVARVHRDYGVVLVAGLNRADDGRKEFAEALKAEPSIALEKDLVTPEVEAAFQAAKGGGGGAATPAPAKGAAAGAGGDIVHTPPTEQAVLTPVPIYVELPDGVNAAKIVARYKPFGMTDWKTLELRKLATGFGAEIPCAEVGSTTGDLSYYIQATDANGDVIGTAGSRNAPLKVAIKSELAGEPPHLPGKPAPSQCHDKADCPPGFPGCSSGKKKTASGNKSWGDACEKDVECGEGLACKNGQCEQGDKSDVDQDVVACESNTDCPEGETCSVDKLCEGTQKLRRNWLSFNVAQDLSLIGSQDDVCGGISSFPPSNIRCIDQDGNDYLGIPEEGAVGDKHGNAIKGGPHIATTRITVGFDHLFGGNIGLGLRLGYALNTAPGHATSGAHVEGRLAYWFGKNPFRKPGIRPFVAVIGGLAEIDDKFSVPIQECIDSPDPKNGPCARAKAALDPPPPTLCQVNPNLGGCLPDTQNLTVWHKSGGAFAGLAGGVMIPVGSRMGVLAELRIQALFPNSGIAVSPSLGYAFGL